MGRVATTLPLAPNPVLISVESVEVRREHFEPAVGDLPAIQVLRRRQDADVRVGAGLQLVSLSHSSVFLIESLNVTLGFAEGIL